MEKSVISERLKNVYDDLSTEIITNTIIDFQEVLKEKYLKTEEVIELVTTNIPNGIKIYDDLGNKFDAICSIGDKEFKVTKEVLERDDYFKYVFFHEFVHSISYKKHNGTQYMGFYSADVNDDYEFKSKAFNEVVTEYLTLKRNKLHDYEKKDGSLSGYDLGTVELELICKIIPEEELIDAYFNHPQDLEEILTKYHMNMDEILYSFYSFEEMDYDIYCLTNRRGIHYLDRLYKLIDGEKFLFYNMLDAIGEINTEDEFNRKWEILLSEQDMKYNFYSIDGLLRYGELCRDIDRLNISENNPIYKRVTKDIINKYRKLISIFDNEDNNQILKELYEIYHKDYHEYFNFIKDDFISLPYTFLEEVKSNFELYDIEMYPRVYPYLEKEQTTIDKVEFRKVACEEANIQIYIFIINGHYYLESNYDDTTIVDKGNCIFEVRYGNQVETLNLNDNTYIANDNKYQIKELY